MATPITGLILLTGEDKPGLTQGLFEALSPFSITVIDIEQMVIRERLFLTVLITLNKAHAKSVEEDLVACAESLQVDIAVSFSEEGDNRKSEAPLQSNIVHVTVLSTELKPGAIAEIATHLANLGANIERIIRQVSQPVTVVEFHVSGATEKEIRSALAHISSDRGVDIGVQSGGISRWARRLVLLDVDSTLIQQEVIELLAAKAGVLEKVKEITDSAMRGEVDFAQSLRARVHLLKGLPVQVIEEVQKEILLTDGARTLISTLQKLGHAVGVVSGGFLEVIEPLLHELDIKLYRANRLEIIDGTITGNLVGEIIDRAGKAKALRDFAEEKGIELAQTIAIGDGANDLDMIAEAGVGIAFNAKPIVRAAADSSISHPNLIYVLYLLGLFDN